MKRIFCSEVDVITAADLPGLRESMIGYAEHECYSSDLRAVCLDVVAAIDQARDADVCTHAVLRGALQKFVIVGQREALLHTEWPDMLPC